ncbi:Chromate resistance protein ChrB [Nonomuraea sp. NPDC003201]
MPGREESEGGGHEAAELGKPVTWLMLIYRVPSEPTRLRAAVWRRLRNLGAVYLQNSAAAAPRTPQSERALRALRSEIVESMSGQAFLVSTSSVIGESDLVALYNAARDDEYEEILDKCADFHKEVEKEVRAKHFTYSELEENEEDLTKLRGWFEKVTVRDVLGAARRKEVVKALDDCARTLEEFAASVYEAEDTAIFQHGAG